MRSAQAGSQLAGRNLDGLALGWLYGLALGWLDFMGLGFFFTEGGGEAATIPSTIHTHQASQKSV